MKQKLEELLFEWMLLKLLDEYDPDRVFRFIANACVLFAVEIEPLQSCIFSILDNKRNDMLVLREILTILKAYHFTASQMTELLHYDDRRKILNLLRYPRQPRPCVLTDEQRQQALKLYHHLHKLGVLLL